MASKSVYIPVINGLRGLAALSVCLYHFVYTTLNFIHEEWVRNIFYYGQKGVEVFFIISGIVIPLSMIRSDYAFSLFPKFIARRFVRIEPPYLGAVVIGIIYLVGRNYIPGTVETDLSPSIRDILLHIGYLVPFVEGAKWINSVFWTLSIEFQYYLLLAFLFPFVLSAKIWSRILFYLVMIALPLFFEDQRFITFWSAFFFLGIAYALHRTEKIKGTEFIILIALASGIVLYRQGIIQLSIGLSTLLVIHAFSSYESKVGRFMGDISYSLYLLHSVIGAAFVNYLSHFTESAVAKTLLILAGFALSVFSAYLYWKWVEKPSQNWSKRIKLRR